MTWKDELRKILGEDPEDMTAFMNVSPRMKREAEKRKEEHVSSYRGMDEYVVPIAEKMYDLILKELDKVVGSIGEENKYSKEEGIEDLRATILAIMYGNNERF